MPPWSELAAVLFLAGVVSYGFTEIVKISCRKWVGTAVNSSDPVWWQVLFRIIPIAVGTLIGWRFYVEQPIWGLSVGCSAGILAAIIYKKAKEMIGALRSPQK